MNHPPAGLLELSFDGSFFKHIHLGGIGGVFHTTHEESRKTPPIPPKWICLKKLPSKLNSRRPAGGWFMVPLDSLHNLRVTSSIKLAAQDLFKSSKGTPTNSNFLLAHSETFQTIDQTISSADLLLFLKILLFLSNQIFQRPA
eukprot:TRINITY_DN18960_c0_g1_i1.p1 TRINITY_DN18960_c0_g1~~TRINITY_DN18960_c0_g1_i1.p1  ORF type:complete len:143 (+),score=18.80 TRINITY_DN18960_c0_g1_i1:255-683(+)